MSHSIYATLKGYYERRKDKTAGSRVWGSGSGVAMDGEDIVVGWSQWVSVGGRYKRTDLRSKIVLVTPDDVVSLHPDTLAHESRQVSRASANLLCEVIGIDKSQNWSAASDPLHVGPKQRIRIGGKNYGLDGNFKVRYAGYKREVLEHTPISRRKTDRTKSRGAYKLSKEIAAIAAAASRFSADDLRNKKLWEGALAREKKLPVLARQLHSAAGGTYEFDPSAQPELVAETVDLATDQAFYQMSWVERQATNPFVYVQDRVRNLLLKLFKEVDGYVPAE